MVNGMSVTSLTGTGGTRTNWSDATVQEYGLQLAAHSAEIPYGGVFTNVLPKDGGNRTSGSVFFNFADEDFQADNLDDDLRSRQFTVANTTKRMIDVNPSLGGALIQDRLWYHAAFRYVVTDNYVGGLYYNANPKAWTYTPDLSRPAISDQETYDTTLNLTLQVSQKHRLSVFGTYDKMCLCHFSISPTVAPEAATYNPGDSSLIQGRWTSTLSSSVLVEAGASPATATRCGRRSAATSRQGPPAP